MEESHKEVEGLTAAAAEGGEGKGRIRIPGLNMDTLASAMERVKALARSCEERIRGGLWKRAAGTDDDSDHPRDDPIDILKRLQREAFFELMKLRDRQEKVERMLAFQKTSKGSPFREDGTHMKGFVDVTGALSFAVTDDQEMADVLNIAGIRTGVNSRFIFETVARQKDTLMAEFVASQDRPGYLGDVPGSPLTLSKALYSANISDRISLILIPLGARCRDFGFGSNLLQFQGFAEPSSFEPPLLSQCLGCATGLRVKCSNITASVAQSVSRLDMQLFSSVRRCLGTFGQVNCEILDGTTVSLLGLWQMPRSSSQPTRNGTLAVRTVGLGPHASSQTDAGHTSSIVARGQMDNVSSGSVAVMLESELDESSRIRGWVELLKSDFKSLQWALSISDTPEDEVGWGLTIGGNIGGDRKRVQLEGYLKFGLGRRFSLQPGLVYTLDGSSQFPAMAIRASWTM
uniref:Major core protein n=1 Tax=Anthurium amnicola TaxID=1678845 RepID=A0A1D1YAW0_9ARAE